MKVVILAGGYGSRISEETYDKPKPMVPIGGRPILWHIMKSYSAYGFNDFIICLGYKGSVIKDYFHSFYRYTSDVTIDLSDDTYSYHGLQREPWKVTLAETGPDTMTGGRLKRIAHYVGNDDFCMTYGDGVGAIDIHALTQFHQSHNKIATVTAVTPLGRFGSLKMQDDKVVEFTEKPKGDSIDHTPWISGGFFVFKPAVFDYLDGDSSILELAPLQSIAQNDELRAFKHDGFWHPMDTVRDRNHLEKLWQSNTAPWKVW